ncbi:hypothetical protein CERZMDRAFT_121499 [Cercospora zeae-maydis SCOH1-5]|uniref:Matrin-type domain-containing protein n=1 Tax=Cercospora zeae-maydis SCOH1-5 TaxID=717836 RepID=A0A6A6FDS7_9PEZI|nr:hypothetical protein CERZMDRAFT_121499 [Cercospora zeae-maydis SCOH1-5]
MSEYWKSTPSYWCKFCTQYVRDTAIERKNHEASGKHQNNIQRSLRELHKGKEREEREKQRAKDEVNRLNSLVSGQKSAAAQPGSASHLARTSKSAPAPPPPPATAQQRKTHAEQLAALGVELPEELKKEVTGVGSYQVVDAHEVDTSSSGAVTVNRSLAEILAETREGQKSVEEEQKASHDEKNSDDCKAGLKRKLDDDHGDPRDEEAAPKSRKAWGSTVKTYPGKAEDVDVADLDALLGGVRKKTKTEDGAVVKQEDGAGSATLDSVPDVEADTSAGIKTEDGASAAPAVVFKKRKGKK